MNIELFMEPVRAQVQDYPSDRLSGASRGSGVVGRNTGDEAHAD